MVSNAGWCLQEGGSPLTEAKTHINIATQTAALTCSSSPRVFSEAQKALEEEMEDESFAWISQIPDKLWGNYQTKEGVTCSGTAGNFCFTVKMGEECEAQPHVNVMQKDSCTERHSVIFTFSDWLSILTWLSGVQYRISFHMWTGRLSGGKAIQINKKYGTNFFV